MFFIVQAHRRLRHFERVNSFFADRMDDIIKIQLLVEARRDASQCLRTRGLPVHLFLCALPIVNVGRHTIPFDNLP